MKNTIQQGDWWNNVILNTNVLLVDFKEQLNLWRSLGLNPSQFVYDLDARLNALRAGDHDVI